MHEDPLGDLGELYDRSKELRDKVKPLPPKDPKK